MPRQVTFALGIFAVLVSASSVGSQDPFTARSEAESAANAAPISAMERLDQSSSDVPGMGATPVALELPPQVEPTSGPAVIVPLEQAPAVAPQPEPPAGLDTEEAPLTDLAQRRLFASVPDEIESYFDLFLYVSKSNRGPLAQRMFVFQRDADGRIIPYSEWRVSTGREKLELHHERKVRTNTPEGIFELDPDRMHRRYWSKSWDNAPMHYAMFYDLMNNGRQSGLAIHAAVGKSKIRKLGKRDSAGCIRLDPKHAKELFYKIQNTTRGQVPVLAMNERKSTDRWGRVLRDEAGAVLLQDGYRAVVFVENYDGREEIVGPVVAYTN
ncbi:MAG: L,D-transpeptidase [Alphaproteobacteria bacterium]|nr:L,D-transpeptidase [Alphaproteobacteria bacterium]